MGAAEVRDVLREELFAQAVHLRHAVHSRRQGARSAKSTIQTQDYTHHRTGFPIRQDPNTRH